MAEYIDREAIYRKACRGCTRHGDEIGICYLEEPCEALQAEFTSAPAADVAPVRHGRWCHKTENLSDFAGFGLIPVRNIWRCSQCSLPIVNETEDPDRLFNYCPNCGAKMDGKETEE